MSRHYLMMTQAELDAERRIMQFYLHQRQTKMNQSEVKGGGKSIDGILEKLQQTKPELANQLKDLDWAAIKRHIGKCVLERSAEELGLQVSDSYDNRTVYGAGDGQPPAGECIGVLHKNKERGTEEAQLGLAIDGTDVSLFWNRYSSEVHGTELEKWRSAVQRIYREEIVHAALRIIGQDVEKQTNEQGTVVFHARIRGGQK